ncbi:Spore coat protein SA [Fundidesulfovibrio magnetotacticus]|uniref:Spore coat protein SA n=1 Tax=Fundidesulfovibrio magnetotacticus TaxID=2730080 RepID=A0A6V8LRL6_9BACT|nr:glycosyltransferase [Fundidesulfovibrio magnetotacticus]GFK92237.1 Spore coat protein SA [Fundidesulfovibrio magnetotacticus]
MISVLFVHRSFPGQFIGLVSHFLRRGDAHVAAICERSGSAPVFGVQYAAYDAPPRSGAGVHPYAEHTDHHVRRGAAAFDAALALKDGGFYPDVIYVHPGWGEALFLRDVFPLAKSIVYCEHYYRVVGTDVGFDPEFPLPLMQTPLLALHNLPTLHALNACDAAVSPTRWQQQGFPEHWAEKIKVLHEGVDTDLIKPDPQACFTLPDGRVLRAGDEVVTYLSRTLEPYRGFHSFMRALPRLLELRPNARVLVAGGEGRGYGPRPPDGAKGWLETCLRENPVDLERVHFLGPLAYPDFLKALQVSACHVYLTYPFVLSWSLIEALAAGCLVVGSSTAPLLEVIEHGRNGLLTDFFDAPALAGLIAAALSDVASGAGIRREARRTAVERFDRSRVCLPAHLELLEGLLGERAR